MPVPRRSTVGLASISTGSELIAGVDVSIKGLIDATLADVLCGKEPPWWTGEMGAALAEAGEFEVEIGSMVKVLRSSLYFYRS